MLAVMGPERLARSMFPLGDVASKEETRARGGRARAVGVGQARLLRHLLRRRRRHPGLPALAARVAAGRDRRRRPATVLGSTTARTRTRSGSARACRSAGPLPTGSRGTCSSVEPVNNRVVVGSADDLAVARSSRRTGPSWFAPAGRRRSPAPLQVRAHGDAGARRGRPCCRRLGGRARRSDGALRGVAPGQSAVLYDGTRVLGQATVTAARRGAPPASPRCSGATTVRHGHRAVAGCRRARGADRRRRRPPRHAVRGGRAAVHGVRCAARGPWGDRDRARRRAARRAAHRARARTAGSSPTAPGRDLARAQALVREDVDALAVAAHGYAGPLVRAGARAADARRLALPGARRPGAVRRRCRRASSPRRWPTGVAEHLAAIRRVGARGGADRAAARAAARAGDGRGAAVVLGLLGAALGARPVAAERTSATVARGCAGRRSPAVVVHGGTAWTVARRDPRRPGATGSRSPSPRSTSAAWETVAEVVEGGLAFWPELRAAGVVAVRRTRRRRAGRPAHCGRGGPSGCRPSGCATSSSWPATSPGRAARRRAAVLAGLVRAAGSSPSVRSPEVAAQPSVRRALVAADRVRRRDRRAGAARRRLHRPRRDDADRSERRPRPCVQATRPRRCATCATRSSRRRASARSTSTARRRRSSSPPRRHRCSPPARPSRSAAWPCASGAAGRPVADADHGRPRPDGVGRTPCGRCAPMTGREIDDAPAAPVTRAPPTEIPAEARHRWTELADLIDADQFAYYIRDAPVSSDKEYDERLRELQALEDEHPGLRTPDSPTQRVGGTFSTEFALGQPRRADALARQRVLRRGHRRLGGPGAPRPRGGRASCTTCASSRSTGWPSRCCTRTAG